MELVFLATILFVALLFYWLGKQYSAVTFVLASGAILLLAGLLVLGNGVTYYYQDNQTTTYSPDYFSFYNDSVTCVNCSNASCSEGACGGTLNCSALLIEVDCIACDQCYWFEEACYTEQDAGCNLSTTCEDCPDCTYANATEFAPYCCEHDGNTTKGGSVIHTVNYAEREIDDEFTIVLGWAFLLMGLFTLLGVGVDLYNTGLTGSELNVEN